MQLAAFAFSKIVITQQCLPTGDQRFGDIDLRGLLRPHNTRTDIFCQASNF